MLEKIREGVHGPAAKVVLFVIIAFFVLSGVSSYLVSGGGAVVAEVDGHEITQPQLERLMYLKRMQMSPQMQAAPGIEQYLQNQTLNELINRQLFTLQADSLDLFIGDGQLRQSIREEPQFQQNGKFSKDVYKATYAQLGYASENQFLADKRHELEMAQLIHGVGFSEFVLDSDIQNFYQLSEQTRDFAFLQISASDFAASTQVTEQEIAEYFEQNQAAFQTEEQLKVNYVELDLVALKSSLQVEQAELMRHYEDNLADYTTPESRRVAHILLTVPVGASNEVLKQTEQQAETLFQQLQDGADFAELAKANSKDASSAEKGGDMGWVEQNSGRDAALEEAIYQLEKEGSISKPVKSKFGYHIVKLLELKPENTLAFEDVAAQVKDQLLTAKAKELFIEKRTQLSDLVYENDASLDTASDVLQLPIKTTELFSRQHGDGIAANSKIRNAAFSEQVVLEARNSDLIDLDEYHVVALHLEQHLESRVPALDEVKEAVQKQVKADKQQAAAKALADLVIGKLQAGEDASALLAEHQLTWREVKQSLSKNGDVDGQVLSAVFAMPRPSAFPQYELSTTDDAVFLVKLTAIQLADSANIAEEMQIQLENRLTNQQGSAVISGILEGLKSTHPVSIKQELVSN